MTTLWGSAAGRFRLNTGSPPPCSLQQRGPTQRRPPAPDAEEEHRHGRVRLECLNALRATLQRLRRVDRAEPEEVKKTNNQS